MLNQLAQGGATVAGFLLLVIFLFGWVWASRYRKVGPNEVLIIYGWSYSFRDPKTGSWIKRGFKPVVGGGAFVWPVIEQYQVLSLELITIDIKTPPVVTLKGVPIIVDGIAQIKVNSDDYAISTAAEQFLSKTQSEIMRIAHQTLEGHLRAILGGMTVEDIYKNRDEFARKVQEVSGTDFANMGLTIVSFTLRDITDDQGYLEALGKPAIAEAKKNAVIGEAEAIKLATIKAAENQQEGEIAKIQARLLVANANRDFEMKNADNTAEINRRKAEMDLAYELSASIKNQEVKKAFYAVQLVEKQALIEIQEREILRKEKELDATVRKPAEAERQRIETLAQAQRYALEQTAAGEAEATRIKGVAKADSEKAQGLAATDVAKAQGLAEADIIRAKGTADAEAMSKKAEAFTHYNQAAVSQMLIDKLPEITRAASEPLSKVERIVMVSNGGDETGAAKITGDVFKMVSQVPPVIEALTGIDLAKTLRGATGQPEPPESVDPKPGKKG